MFGKSLRKHPIFIDDHARTPDDGMPSGYRAPAEFDCAGRRIVIRHTGICPDRFTWQVGDSIAGTEVRFKDARREAKRIAKALRW